MKKQVALSEFIAHDTSKYSSNTMVNNVAAIQQFFDFNPEILDVESYVTEHVEKWNSTFILLSLYHSTWFALKINMEEMTLQERTIILFLFLSEI